MTARRRLELPALGHQQPCLHPVQGARGDNEGESWWLMKIMIIMAMITVTVVKSFNGSAAFTHDFLDTGEFVK